jgi:hypothetical protein
MTTSRIGRGAIVTLGAAASLAWAAGAANACETPPKNPTPPTQDHHRGDKTPPKTTPNTVCTVDQGDVEWAPVGADGKATGPFKPASSFTRIEDKEPVYGIQVELTKKADNCTGSVPVSLASYDTHGKTWEGSGGVQTFVDYDTTTLSNTPQDASSHVLKVKVPGTPGGPCFGQIDLYFGSTIYDGGTAKGHGPLPNHDGGVSAPKSSELIAAWNGSDAGGCAVTPPVTPPTTTPPTTPPTTSPTTHPSTPVTSTTTAPPKPSSSTSTTPSTPATTTSSPGTPTLAHTGANVGEVSLVALAFFGAGGTVMFASRKAKTVGARKH